MQLKGVNTECKNECVKDALKQSGYKLLDKKISWPRLKGPAGLRVDVGSGHMVGTVVHIGKRELTIDYAN